MAISSRIPYRQLFVAICGGILIGAGVSVLLLSRNNTVESLRPSGSDGTKDNLHQDFTRVEGKIDAVLGKLSKLEVNRESDRISNSPLNALKENSPLAQDVDQAAPAISTSDTNEKKEEAEKRKLLQSKMKTLGFPRQLRSEQCWPRIKALEDNGVPLELLKWSTTSFNFGILVYRQNDIVSSHILRSGSWEVDHLALAEAQMQGRKHERVYLDIGGNIGYHTLLAAKKGYSVDTFEAMPKNAALINASLCGNPKLDPLVTLYQQGVGRKKQMCTFISGDDNVGDGVAQCGDDIWQGDGYSHRGRFEVDTLSKLLSKDYFMMKMDIEGLEPDALSVEGAGEYFKAHRIHYIQTETWPDEDLPGRRQGLLTRLTELGYALRKCPEGGPHGHWPPIFNAEEQGTELQSLLTDGAIIDLFGELQ